MWTDYKKKLPKAARQYYNEYLMDNLAYYSKKAKTTTEKQRIQDLWRKNAIVCLRQFYAKEQVSIKDPTESDITFLVVNLWESLNSSSS